MPDGDKVHAHLAPIYQKVYKQLCEGQYGSEELAIEALRSIKKNIQNYGDGPLNLIEQVAAQLKQIPTEPLLREIIDWSEESTKVDKLAQQASGTKRAVDLVLKACKEQLQELRHGAYPQDLMFELTIKYLRNVYMSNFEKHIPLAKHYHGVSQATVDARLDCMWPHVDQGIVALAMQVVHKGSIHSLRLPRRPKLKCPIDLDADLSLIAV